MKRNNPSNEKKRGGLGRGLEVLLADTSPVEDAAPPPTAAAAETATAAVADTNTVALQTALQAERKHLLQEAEALRILLLEFDLLVRADLH